MASHPGGPLYYARVPGWPNVDSCLVHFYRTFRYTQPVHSTLVELRVSSLPSLNRAYLRAEVRMCKGTCMGARSRVCTQQLWTKVLKCFAVILGKPIHF